MGYEIKRIDNDDLADYAFQINGALALKNYTATVEGSRLRIAHTQNAALSILECEVSEVEIDGRVYDNPADAQRALESIVYSDLPILVLTREERDRFLELDSVKLEKTSFESFKTENTEALNQKVDKEEGKGLSANDFTNVYKEVLDNLPVELSTETTIKFDRDRDYGTRTRPIDTFTLDLAGAKRGVVNVIFFNGARLPTHSAIDWSGSSVKFIPNTTCKIILMYLDNRTILGNLL
ncbi:hypothetical protein ACT8PC_10680 [Ornithobacterium rhinotracheale]|uniref:hypothetical protein n=2 Tax=Ornithobacterium rhinotracheale TaxID=28251 RepID=UPI004039F678